MRVRVVDVTVTEILPNGLLLSRDDDGCLRAHARLKHVGYVNAWNNRWQMDYFGPSGRVRRFYRFRDRAEALLRDLAAAEVISADLPVAA